MFTGLVEETGRVLAFEPVAGAWSLAISASVIPREVVVGDSIAVNGCCLTAVRCTAAQLSFDVLEETRRLTNFSALRTGARVNLERSLRFGDRMGGHFVTGHIDTMGVIEVFEARGPDRYLRVQIPPAFGRYVILKGSIAIDGISLTIAEVTATTLAVWIIPHTLAVTNLVEKNAGDAVNLEFDLLGKHVEKLLSARPA